MNDFAASPVRTESLVIIGGGGHALVVAEAAGLTKLHVAGFVDDQAAAHIAAGEHTLVHLGTLEQLDRLAGRPWLIALGDIGLRRRILERLDQSGIGGNARTVVHPTAFVSPSATLGRGVYVGPLAIVHSRARVEDHAVVNSGAIVEHDCAIGANSHVAPGVAMGGGVRVGPDTLVGMGSRILPRLTIGTRCTIGAGAIVTRSVSDGSTVVGVPAREPTRAGYHAGPRRDENP